MSAVTNQPLPIGQLEREKHIQTIFRAFRNRCGPSCESHTHSPQSQTPPDRVPAEQMSGPAPGMKMENGPMEPPGKLNKPEAGEQWLEGAGASDSLTVLDTVSQIHITVTPELQGPQCVPRRIYSITTGASRSQSFVVVEESSCLSLQCCGPARACSLQGFDCQGRQVFYFKRPLRLDACCFGCCLMELKAYTPQQHLIGTVHQRWSMFTPLLEVWDSEDASTIRIQGPCCPCRCSSNQQFQNHMFFEMS
ncbi:hypothetical protein PAMA_005103 [Pampus argenteus]